MKRGDFIKNLIGLYGIASMPKSLVKHYEKVYLLQCFVRGFQFYNGPKILKELNKNDLLDLVREPDNEYDDCAIALYHNEHKIGFIPREENMILSILLDANLLKLQAEIGKIEPKARTWENVFVAIYALREIDQPLSAEDKRDYHFIQTPDYYTLKPRKSYYNENILYRFEVTEEVEYIYNNQTNHREKTHYFELMQEHSSLDVAQGFIDDCFSSEQTLEEAFQQSKIIIQKEKAKGYAISDLAEQIDTQVLNINHLFDNEGYIVANVDKIAEMPKQIERFVKKIDVMGNVFYEAVLKMP